MTHPRQQIDIDTRPRIVEAHRIDACTTIEDVCAAPADQQIIAVPAEQLIVALTTDQRVAATVCRQNVIASAAIQLVVGIASRFDEAAVDNRVTIRQRHHTLWQYKIGSRQLGWANAQNIERLPIG